MRILGHVFSLLIVAGLTVAATSAIATHSMLRDVLTQLPTYTFKGEAPEADDSFLSPQESNLMPEPEVEPKLTQPITQIQEKLDGKSEIEAVEVVEVVAPTKQELEFKELPIPKVELLSMMEGETEVSPNSTILLGMGTVPNFGVLAVDCIRLYDASGSAEIDVVASDDLVALMPKKPLRKNSVYTIEVCPDVENFSGKSAGKLFLQRFTTAAS